MIARFAPLLRNSQHPVGRFSSLLLAVLLPALASAHAGGLDSYGCHHDRSIGEYHCHEGPLAGYDFPSKAEMLQELKRRGLEGKPTAKPSDVGQLIGRVVGLVDGDTITVLDASKTLQAVRLAGIDAPERGQPYWRASRKHLADLIAGKTVTVDYHKKDRDGRYVGNVYLDGRDLGLAQIEVGMAWHFKRYMHEQTVEEGESYAQAETEARAKGIGLWQDKRPVPPWDWRDRKALPKDQTTS